MCEHSLASLNEQQQQQNINIYFCIFPNKFSMPGHFYDHVMFNVKYMDKVGTINNSNDHK